MSGKSEVRVRFESGMMCGEYGECSEYAEYGVWRCGEYDTNGVVSESVSQPVSKSVSQ